VQESGLMMGGGDTYLIRTAAAEVSVGTGLGLLLGAPDGVLGLGVAQVTEGSDPAAAAASKAEAESMSEEQRAANLKRLRDQMAASGLVPAEPKA